MKTCWRSYLRPLSLFITAFLFSLVTRAQCDGSYCNSNFTSVSFEYITNVQFAGINNPSGGNTGGPVNYTGQSGNVTIGTPSEMIVTVVADAGDYLYAFIDWNQNGILNDGGEVYTLASNTDVDGDHSIMITPPAGAVPGSTRMRIMMDWNGVTPNPCKSGTWGEAEDYCLNVVPAEECTGINVLGNTLASVSSICTGLNFSLSIQNFPTTGGISYQWQTSLDGETWTNAGPNSPSWSTSITASTYYQVTATCTATGDSDTSTPVLVETVPCIHQPAGTGSLAITACNGTYYDTGGADNNYSVSQNSVLTILPEGDNLVQITFTSFNIENSWDYLLIYDGDNTSGTLITSDFINPGFGSAPNGAWTNTLGNGVTITSSLGPLTLVFFSDGSVVNPGWTATISCIEAPSCLPPTAVTATSASDGSSTIDWTASSSESTIGYEWIVVEEGAGFGATPIVSGTTSGDETTAIAEGLEEFVTYHVFIRSICDDESNSLWMGPIVIAGACTDDIFGQYPSTPFEPVCNGEMNTIVTCAYAGEYSMVAVEEDMDYIFGISVPTDIITITSEDGTTVYATGTGGSLTWVSTVTGNIRFYTHIPGCGSQSTCRVKTVQCGEPWVNEADVEILYTLGGVPMVYGDEHMIQAVVTNPAADTWTKTVTLNIAGANTFTSTYELTLDGYSTEIISFEPFTPTNLGMQTVTVSVEDDNVNSNNSYSVEQLVTPNLFSHKEPGAPMAEGGVGIGGGYTGNFVAKFTTSAPAEVNEIKVDFTGEGGINYQYRVFAADGPNGLPGTVLFDSPVQVSTPGQAFLPVSPAVPVDGDFYVGLRELGTNFQFNYQEESPLRSGIFYFNTEDGTYPWTDISTSGAPTARLAIEAQLFTETAPNCALNAAPTNGNFTCHMAGTTLTWASGGGAPTGYHVYFGTEPEPPLVGDVTTASYQVESLEENTVYYWYVVPFNAFGDATGCTEVHTFTASMEGCFCYPEYTTGTGSGDLISNVEIPGTTLANNTGTTPGGPFYTYFTGEPNYTAELQAGTSYEVVISTGSFGGQHVAVWIDYNDNGSFELSERIGYTTTSINGNSTAALPIYLDCQAPIGTHRMRVRMVWNTLGVDIDPCASYGWGETEDYDITITEAPACPTPFGGIAEYITDVSAILFWSAGCLEENWDVHLTEAGGGAPTGEPSHPNATSPLNVDGLEPFTFYEFWVMANCDDETSSDWAGPFTFATWAFPPPVNDNPCGAIAIPVNEECVYTEATNDLATNTPFVPTPSCASYGGSDVWFTVVVPANGIITIDTQEGTIEDASMAIYTADECMGTFTQIACNDDDSPSGGDWMPYVSLSNQTPGQTLYIRIFSYGNFESGTIGICATSPCLAPATAQIVTNVVNNTVTITWPSMGPGVSYNWELREDGAAGSGETGLVESGTTDETSVTITGLNYLSVYSFYISTNCSEESTSAWSDAVSVVTGLEPGCTDETACNYNPNAVVDDGSCIAEETMWYADADGDGFGDAEVSQMACVGPEGHVSNDSDCDDTDETVWQSGNLFIDADGDGYDAGSQAACYGSTAPAGLSLTSNGNDCNDNDPNSHGQQVLDVTLSLPVPEVCHNSTGFTLTGGSPAGGTWSSTTSGAITGNQFSAVSAGIGNHTITYSVGGDGICTIGGSASANLAVVFCPGVDEDNSQYIALYPTYTTGNVTVMGVELKEAVIMDVNGKRITTHSLRNSSVIPMEELPAGIYFVRIEGNEIFRTFKVVRVN
jgi:hypothetical protein